MAPRNLRMEAFCEKRVYMTRTLYTGRLWFKATEAELKEWFGQYGPVEAATISEDPETDPPDTKGAQRVGRRGEVIDMLGGQRDEDELRPPDPA